MAAAMGETRHVPVDRTKESELNSWSQEETAAGFWFSGPDSLSNLTNTVFNQSPWETRSPPAAHGTRLWSSERHVEKTLLICKISPAPEPVC